MWRDRIQNAFESKQLYSKLLWCLWQPRLLKIHNKHICVLPYLIGTRWMWNYLEQVMLLQSKVLQNHLWKTLWAFLITTNRLVKDDILEVLHMIVSWKLMFLFVQAGSWNKRWALKMERKLQSVCLSSLFRTCAQFSQLA